MATESSISNYKVPQLNRVYNSSIIDNLVFLRIKPRKLSTIDINRPGGQYTFDDNITFDFGGNSYTDLSFVLNSDLNYQISHTWEDDDTIAGAIRSTLSGGAKAVDKAKGVAGPIPAKKYINDSPLTYKDSPRREISFEFDVTAITDAASDVFLPIDALIKSSLPSFGGSDRTTFSIAYEYPTIYKLDIVKGGIKTGMFNMDAAVITSIVPTWKAPYIKGFPSQCQLSITFKEMAPLYRETYNGADGSVNISVTAKGGGTT